MQLVFDFPTRSACNFGNFVVCEGNRTAYHFARQLADANGSEQLLYLYGPSGSGKSHLLAAIARELSPDGSAAAPCFGFAESDAIYQGDFRPETRSRLADLCTDAPALLVDDIHLMPDRQSVRVEFWQLFNDFQTSGRKIVITGLQPPRELPGLDGHLISRLLWGLVARLDISDDTSRRRILLKLAEDRQVQLPEEVIDYLLSQVRRDIPSLRDAFERVNRLALTRQRRISIRLAREALLSEH